MTAEIDEALWRSYGPQERGSAVLRLRKAGWTLERIARSVGCTEGLIRQYERVGKAPASVQAALKNGQSVRATLALLNEQDRLVAEQERARAAARFTRYVDHGFSAICHWLKRVEVPGWDQEQILLEVLALSRGTLVRGEKLWGGSIKAIFEGTRPAGLDAMEDGVDIMNARLEWLYRFLTKLIGDPEMREAAICRAIGKAGSIGVPRYELVRPATKG